jgi:hypothetical protein
LRYRTGSQALPAADRSIFEYPLLEVLEDEPPAAERGDQAVVVP